MFFASCFNKEELGKLLGVGSHILLLNKNWSEKRGVVRGRCCMYVQFYLLPQVNTSSHAIAPLSPQESQPLPNILCLIISCMPSQLILYHSYPRFYSHHLFRLVTLHSSDMQIQCLHFANMYTVSKQTGLTQDSVSLALSEPIPVPAALWGQQWQPNQNLP